MGRQEHCPRPEGRSQEVWYTRGLSGVPMLFENSFRTPEGLVVYGKEGFRSRRQQITGSVSARGLFRLRRRKKTGPVSITASLRSREQKRVSTGEGRRLGKARLEPGSARRRRHQAPTGASARFSHENRCSVGQGVSGEHSAPVSKSRRDS